MVNLPFFEWFLQFNRIFQQSLGKNLDNALIGCAGGGGDEASEFNKNLVEKSVETWTILKMFINSESIFLFSEVYLKKEGTYIGLLIIFSNSKGNSEY